MQFSISTNVHGAMNTVVARIDYEFKDKNKVW